MGRHRPRFEADAPKALLASHADDVVEHGLTDPGPARRFDGLHRFQLCVVAVKLLQCTDPERLAIAAEAKERDCYIEEAADVECMAVFWWAVFVRVCQMARKQLTYIVGPWVVDRDKALRHQTSSDRIAGRSNGLALWPGHLSLGGNGALTPPVFADFPQ